MKFLNRTHMLDEHMEVLLSAAYEFCGAMIGYIFVRLGFGMACSATHIPAESLPKTHPIIRSAIVCSVAATCENV